MPKNGGARQIKRVRNEILVALKMLCPAALQGDQILRTLLGVFPQSEWDQIKKDLAYLCEKGYLQRIIAESENDARVTRQRIGPRSASRSAPGICAGGRRRCRSSCATVTRRRAPGLRRSGSGCDGRRR